MTESQIKEGKRLLVYYQKARTVWEQPYGCSIEEHNTHLFWKARWADWCIKNGVGMLDEIAKLREQTERKCECGELVSYPENVHCGACA